MTEAVSQDDGAGLALDAQDGARVAAIRKVFAASDRSVDTYMLCQLNVTLLDILAEMRAQRQTYDLLYEYVVHRMPDQKGGGDGPAAPALKPYRFS